MSRGVKHSLLDALFPQVRQRLLESFFMNPDRWWYHSDLANHLQLRPSSLQRELAVLTQAGIIKRRRDGNRVYYQANLACPIAPELQGLFLKTSGLMTVLMERLGGLLAKADFAFVYGGMARGEVESTSDVDLMIVGDIGLSEVVSPLRNAEHALGREIHPAVMTWDEFAGKAREGNHYVTTVLKGEKLFVKGSNDELAEALEGAAGKTS